MLLINLDFQDFVYSHLWGHTVLGACARRGRVADVVTVHPFVGRDLACELGIDRRAIRPHPQGTTIYVEQPDLAASQAAIAELLARHRYTTVIVNCDAALFAHLLLAHERELGAAQWVVYDRHFHINLEAHDANDRLRERIRRADVHLFAIQEIATGAEVTTDSDLFAEHWRGSAFARSIQALGFRPPNVHLVKWPLHDRFFAPQPAPSAAERAIVFTGGDSGRDYATLFEAIDGLPLELRLCAGRYPTPPPNVTVLPRLRLHQFRDELARADILAVPLSGDPPVSGITVVAMARMLARVVVASDTPVVRMHIPESGAGGVLVPIGNAAELRAALEQLLASPAERERLAAAGRAGAAIELSLAAFVERMLDLPPATRQSDARVGSSGSGDSPR